MSPDYRELIEERDALRRQVAELVANGVSIHKAADRAAKAERAAIVAWLRSHDPLGWGDAEHWADAEHFADGIEQGAHEVKL